jgi:hypothetical protein
MSPLKVRPSLPPFLRTQVEFCSKVKQRGGHTLDDYMLGLHSNKLAGVQSVSSAQNNRVNGGIGESTPHKLNYQLLLDSYSKIWSDTPTQTLSLDSKAYGRPFKRGSTVSSQTQQSKLANRLVSQHSYPSATPSHAIYLPPSYHTYSCK